MKRHIYLKMKSVEEAREIFLSRFDLETYLSPEEIPTTAALGRMTAAPVFARLSSPHYHSAAMDGYAVVAEATFGASQDKPILLELGRQALPVNTGNPLPIGANAVIMVENVDPVDESFIRIEAAAYPWQHVRKVGEDLVAHEMVLPEKTEITPYAMGALLAAGVTRLLVRRRPRVVIIPTGDELISVQEIENDQVPPGRIIEFNSVMLAALVEQLGALAEIHPLVPDRHQKILAALEKALGKPAAREVLGRFRDCLAACDNFAPAPLEQLLHDFVQQQGIKIGEIIHPVRVALTGKSVGFGLFDSLAILGKQRCLARIDRTLNQA